MPTIRKYNDEDLSELLDVWYDASLIAHPFLSAEFLADERINIEATYIPMAETWVYEVDDRVIGFLSLIGDEVGAIFVDPAHQGQGIGRQLMDHAKSLREQLEVDVFKANELGRHFYRAYGFTFIREHVHEQTGQPVLRLRLLGA